MELPTTPGMVLRSLVSGPSLADVPVPACLNHCINQEAFSCKVRHLVFLGNRPRQIFTNVWARTLVGYLENNDKKDQNSHTSCPVHIYKLH